MSQLHVFVDMSVKVCTEGSCCPGPSSSLVFLGCCHILNCFALRRSKASKDRRTGNSSDISFNVFSVTM